ncbi:MAG: hypothetical protein ACPGWR_09820 [Ardenticatenaceae bacterium]
MSIRTYTQPISPLLFAKKKIKLHRDTSNMLVRGWPLLLAAPLFALLIGAVIGNVSPRVPLHWLMAAGAGVGLSLAGLLLVMRLVQLVRARWAAK